MKRIFFIGGIIAVAAASHAQVKMPPPAPLQAITQEFALGTIELRYSRPTLKVKNIFGNLVPYNKLWRTGANAATIITFSDAVEIGGKKIEAGAYALYSIPNEDSWEILLNKGIKNWGTAGYKESEDLVHFSVLTKNIKSVMETLTMQFTDITSESCELQITWGYTTVAIPIRARIKDRLRNDIEHAMATDTKPFWSAAQFYYEYEQNDTKALENIKAAVAANPKAYYMWLYKAKIEKDMGDRTAAMASSQRSLQLAREAKDEDYILMNGDFQKKLK